MAFISISCTLNQLPEMYANFQHGTLVQIVKPDGEVRFGMCYVADMGSIKIVTDGSSDTEDFHSGMPQAESYRLATVAQWDAAKLLNIAAKSGRDILKPIN